MSLKNKIATLAAVSHQDPIAGNDVARLSSIVVSRLWVHLQRTLSTKSTTPLQACVASSVHVTPDSDEMLAETDQQPITQHQPHQSSVFTAPNGVVKAGYPHGVVDDGHMILPERSASSVIFHSHQGTEQMLGDLHWDPVAQELQDDLLVHAEPYHKYATGYFTSTHSALLQKPTTDENQHSLGASLRTELPPKVTETPILTEPKKSHEEESLFDDCGEHDVESTEELLLAF
jgi:hypothetical protein